MNISDMHKFERRRGVAGLTYLPVTQEIAGSNPVASAIFFVQRQVTVPSTAAQMYNYQEHYSVTSGGGLVSRRVFSGRIRPEPGYFRRAIA